MIAQRLNSPRGLPTTLTRGEASLRPSSKTPKRLTLLKKTNTRHEPEPQPLRIHPTINGTHTSVPNKPTQPVYEL